MLHELDSWREEMRSAYLYRVISDCESGNTRQVLFLELARAADEQAALWATEIRKSGHSPPTEYTPDLRARVVAWLVRHYSPRPMRGVLAAMKVRGMSLYSASTLPHGIPTRLEEVGRRHRGGGSGTLRAAVFGVNDGLVSNASLVMGVAGATSDNQVIVLSGIAGLLAGAFSMAAGEFISVRSQREMYEYQIGLERDELAQYPREEAAELALIYEAKGVARAEAKHIADRIIEDPDRALDTLAREELGLNPEDLGSGRSAALSSFVSFALGATVPLLPFLFQTGASALALSAGATGVALFAVGAVLSLFTGRRALQGGLRMLAIGALAGGATYLAGRALGVTLS